MDKQTSKHAMTDMEYEVARMQLQIEQIAWKIQRCTCAQFEHAAVKSIRHTTEQILTCKKSGLACPPNDMEQSKAARSSQCVM
ncbi:MAG: hypothetical protein ABF868_02725 [Sporolactobacillus sp.]